MQFAKRLVSVLFVFFLATSQSALALSARALNLINSENIDGTISCSPVFYGDGTSLTIISGSDSQLALIIKPSGERVFSALPENIRCETRLLHSAHFAFITANKNLLTIDKRGNSRLYRFNQNPITSLLDAPESANSKLYVVSKNGLILLQANSGSEDRSLSASLISKNRPRQDDIILGEQSWGPLRRQAGYLRILGNSFEYFDLDGNFRSEWRYSDFGLNYSTGVVKMSKPAIDKDGFLVFGAENGRLFRYSPSYFGTVAMSENIEVNGRPEDFSHSQPLVVSGEYLFSSCIGNLYLARALNTKKDLEEEEKAVKNPPRKSWFKKLFESIEDPLDLAGSIEDLLPGDRSNGIKTPGFMVAKLDGLPSSKGECSAVQSLNHDTHGPTIATVTDKTISVTSLSQNRSHIFSYQHRDRPEVKILQNRIAILWSEGWKTRLVVLTFDGKVKGSALVESSVYSTHLAESKSSIEVLIRDFDKTQVFSTQVQPNTQVSSPITSVRSKPISLVPVVNPNKSQ